MFLIAKATCGSSHLNKSWRNSNRSLLPSIIILLEYPLLWSFPTTQKWISICQVCVTLPNLCGFTIILYYLICITFATPQTSKFRSIFELVWPFTHPNFHKADPAYGYVVACSWFILCSCSDVASLLFRYANNSIYVINGSLKVPLDLLNICVASNRKPCKLDISYTTIFHVHSLVPRFIIVINICDSSRYHARWPSEFPKDSMSGINTESQINSFSSLFLVSHGIYSVMKEMHTELKHLSYGNREFTGRNNLVYRRCRTNSVHS